MSNNNISRQLFVDFLEDKGYSRLDQRNIFMDNSGHLGAFAFCPGIKHYCRQFYEECEYLIVVDGSGDEFYYPKEKLAISRFPNRVTPYGVKAYTAIALA